MRRSSIDYQGIISLNQTIVDQLYRYLEQQETRLSETLVQIIQVPQSVPILEHDTMRLSDAVEIIDKNIRALVVNYRKPPEMGDWKEITKKVNRALWDYLEVLEESVKELFQQLDYVPIDEWRDELATVVQSLKEILAHRLEDLQWARSRLEYALRGYFFYYKPQSFADKWKQIGLLFSRVIDKSFIHNLNATQKILKERYTSFAERYDRFKVINTKLDQVQQKFSWSRIFNRFDGTAQYSIKRLFRLLPLWELNKKNGVFLNEDVVRILRNFISPTRACEFFHEYFEALKKTLFDKSRAIKSHQSDFLNEENLMQIDEEILSYRSELQVLEGLLNNYTSFQRSREMQPYTQNGLTSKEIQKLTDKIKNLDEMYENFRLAIERKTAIPDPSIRDVDDDVQQTLHEMGQPLSSSAFLRIKAERLINLLSQLDELTQSNSNVVTYVGTCLNKAMRSDWKYHVLYGIPDFKTLYETHHNIVGPSEERAHQNRYYKFQEILDELHRWLRNKDTARHLHSIEMDISDMKGYLQDYLASVQRAVNEEVNDLDYAKRQLIEMSNQLLEYRYLFGGFFYQLHDNLPEERLIRNQFLFVDQYLEAVDNQLHAWKDNLSNVDQ